MEATIHTARLKLTLVTRAERGSKELEWYHSLYSNEKTSYWSLGGGTKTVEETEERLKRHLPGNNEAQNSYKVSYAVHRRLASSGEARGDEPTEFIGAVNLKAVGSDGLPLPGHSVMAAASEATTLSTEAAYLFLPEAWGKGYATEALTALYDACQEAPSFWAPFSRVYVRALVNTQNRASQRVVEKSGMTQLGVFEWSGPAVFIAGKWRDKDSIQIWGRVLAVGSPGAGGEGEEAYHVRAE